MITLRPMESTRADYQAMQDWFAEPELKRFVWCDEKGEPDVPLARVMEKYGQRIKHPKAVFPYFVLLNDNPIGFIQYYFAQETTVGLDMWLGTPQVRGKGYGSEALRQMVQLIHQQHPAVRVLWRTHVQTGPVRQVHRPQRHAALRQQRWAGHQALAPL